MTDPSDPPGASDRSTSDRNADRPQSEDGRSGPAPDDASPATNAGSTADLRLAIVEYECGPDRGTIHPPQVTGVDRMETWMSVDMGIVVDCSAWR